MTLEKDFFRQVMGRFATGVTVVTTVLDGVPGGLTVSAFLSLSIEPPLVLISVERMSSTLPMIQKSKIFAVNFLTDQQSELSRCFATPSRERFEHFCNVSYARAATGAPILDDVLAFVDTRVVAEYPGGDHILFIGQVEAMGTAGKVVFANEEARAASTLTPKMLLQYTEQGERVSLNGSTPPGEPEPLAYYRGQYRHLAQHYHEPSTNAADGTRNNVHESRTTSR